MRTTIKDVAKRAGVSAATVSLVLNKPNPSISKETRENVMKAVKELQYRPNRLAASLASKKSNTIGVIVPDNSNLFLAEFSNCIETAISKHGYAMILGNASNSATKTIKYLYDFSDRSVDGIILVQSIFENPEHTATCIEALTNLQIPTILSDRFPITHSFESVKTNDFLGGYLAIKHLLDMGHNQIGIIAGEMYFPNCIERLEGCKKALLEAGIPFDQSLVYEGDFQMSSGAAALPYLLEKNVTAIFTFNDMIAYGVYKALSNYNLKVPEDISIIGFDDIWVSDVICPPLTTIEYPLKEIAETVVDRLISLIDGREANTQHPIVFDPTLKIKGSTAFLYQLERGNE